MRGFTAVLSGCVLLLASGIRAAVLDLTPENFDAVVGGDKPAFVEFYAPWCGHCKALAPEYEVLGETIKDTDGVVVARLDAAEHHKLAMDHGVTGYPTLIWYSKGSTSGETYEGGRNAEEMVSFINGKTGLQRRVKKAPTAVAHLTEQSFDSVVMDPSKAALVEFYAPWCGHCKNLAPTYEKVAATFAGDDDVVVAAVDATVANALASRYDVSGFPTIKFFPKGEDKEPETYDKGRDGQSFVEFLNEKAGTARELGGGLASTFGRVPDLDELASSFLTAADKKDVLNRAKEAAAKLSGKAAEHGKHYIKTMEKVLAKGTDYVAKESARLGSMIESEAVQPLRKDLFRLRKNILQAFK